MWELLLYECHISKYHITESVEEKQKRTIAQDAEKKTHSHELKIILMKKKQRSQFQWIKLFWEST